MIGDVGQQEDLLAAQKKSLPRARLPQPSKICARICPRISFGPRFVQELCTSHSTPRHFYGASCDCKTPGGIALKLGATALPRLHWQGNDQFASNLPTKRLHRTSKLLRRGVVDMIA